MVVLRPATLADEAMLRAWRNDPDTCAASITSETVNAADHHEWFAAALASPRRWLFIAEDDGVAVGTGRIDKLVLDHLCTLSVTVAPAHRGRRFAEQIIEALVDRAHDLGFETCLASVKGGNTPSMHAFMRTGFHANGIVTFIR